MTPSQNTQRHFHTGFTLVEVLTVIVIIGILTALLIPAVTGAIRTARETAIKLEIQGISDAIEQYNNTYGDYPPDFSDASVVQRHYRKIFPQITTQELGVITALMSNQAGKIDPFAINRAEALVLTLGGYSSDKRQPLTGQGGPLIIDTTDPFNVSKYRYNPDRQNQLFEFESEKLTLSNEPEGFAADTNVQLKADPLPSYLPGDSKMPLLYFDSRTYGLVSYDGKLIGNGYSISATTGGARPYKTNLQPQNPSGSTYGNFIAATDAIRFKNADTFQLISAGLDSTYSAVYETTSPDAAQLITLPIYFTAETGISVAPNPGAANYLELRFPAGDFINGFQESTYSSENINAQYDNITNFSSSRLENDLVEVVDKSTAL